MFLDGAFNQNLGTFSPDGSLLAYVSRESGERRVYIRPFPHGGSQHPVSVAEAAEPAWGQNGELFYRRLSDYTLMAVTVTTGAQPVVGTPRPLVGGTEGPPAAGGRARYAVSGDAERFLLAADMLPRETLEPDATPRLHVRVVQNWTQELLERVPVP